MSSIVLAAEPLFGPKKITYHLACIFCASLFLALLSQFSIPLWFTPVPLTLQALGVMLIGAFLGSKRGAAAVLLYLTEGALGLPVFASFSSGTAILFGPRGGYLFAFVISAFLIGWLLERGWRKSSFLTVAALVLGSLVTLTIGALWLSCYVGFFNALVMGVYPFLLGDLVIKVAAALTLIRSKT